MVLRGIMVLALALYTFALGYALGYTDADWPDAYVIGLVDCESGEAPQ